MRKIGSTGKKIHKIPIPGVTKNSNNIFIFYMYRTMKRTKRESGIITWFNPPFNIIVATNVAKTILSLIDKHFPKDKKLSKIFNRNTIKVSYSCLPNVKQTISKNNHRLLQLHRMKESTQDSKLCNCRQKALAHLTASASLNALYIL